MSKITIYNLKGESVGEREIADELLETRGDQAVQDVITAYRAGLRAGTASTKTRANVSGGGRKPYKQKGSGNARQGSRRSPVLRGGGIVFGPHPRDYSKKVNKQVVALAFRRVLSDRIAAGALAGVEGFDSLEPKTKNVAGLLAAVAKGTPVLVLTANPVKNLTLAARTIPQVVVTTASQANTYQVARSGIVLADAAGLDVLLGRLGAGEE